MSAETELLLVGGPDVAWRETGGEIVVLDLTGAVYFGLNGTGAQLWKRLVDGASRQDLLDHLSSQADRNGPQLDTDLDDFLADLDRHGLLRRVVTDAGASRL